MQIDIWHMRLTRPREHSPGSKWHRPAGTSVGGGQNYDR